jgi:hypothetical protein
LFSRLHPCPSNQRNNRSNSNRSIITYRSDRSPENDYNSVARDAFSGAIDGHPNFL